MKPRVLHLITVYNGRAFVPRAIESAVRMDQSDATIDVLILDDASPEPGWSADLKGICKHLGAHYYCSPRNLGIPRNCSLGLTAAIDKNYDFVTINNSDVIFPSNLISIMIEACKREKVGSVTAWSNNVSIYSIPNLDPDRYLSNQTTVDFVSSSLASKYGGSVFDAPAGISFCIMMPVDVVKAIGVMDPLFGRGYCEETDWSLRSLAAGFRICVSPGVFVYHMGRGSNLAAGLVSGAHTTVPENEAIIDRRYPKFREQCQAFEASGLNDRYKAEAIDHLINVGAEAFGFSIVPGWETLRATESSEVFVELLPDADTVEVRVRFAGFAHTSRINSVSEVVEGMINRFGADKLNYNAFDLSGSWINGGVSPYQIKVF